MGKTGVGKPQRSRKHKKLKVVGPTYLENLEYSGRCEAQTSHCKRSGKTNQGPENPDVQEIPKSLKQMMYLQKQAKLNIKRRWKRKKHVSDEAGNVKMEKGMTRPSKPAPVFKRRPGESEQAFHWRMERVTQSVINKAKIEDKLGVELNVTDKGVEAVTKTKKKEKMKLRLKAKKEKKKQAKQHLPEPEISFEQFTDDIQFGEVAMEPPSLSARPKKSRADESTGRPGMKSLLLKDIISKETMTGNKDTSKTQKDITQKNTHSRKVGETLKRKHMAPVRQRIMDEERDKAIDLYRQLKNKKTKL